MFKKQIKTYNGKKFKIIYWIPRISTIFLILLNSLLSLDVFTEFDKWYEQILAFLIHLIPSVLLAIILFISWDREIIAGLFFFVFGIFTIFVFNMEEDLSNFIIPLILITIGLTFILNWYLIRISEYSGLG